MNLGTQLIGLLLDLTEGITWYKGRNSFPLYQNSFLPCCLILETGGGDVRSQVFPLFDVWKWGIFGRESSHSLLSDIIHVCAILRVSFKYAFVYFSFCQASRRSCDVLYLHLSPLLLSSSFSLFKLLSFFFNFFLTQLNSTCSDISQNFIASNTLMAIAGNVFTNRQSFVLKSSSCLEQVLSAGRICNYAPPLRPFWSLKQRNGP